VAWLAAIVSLVVLVATWYAAFHIGAVKHIDQSAFRGFTDLDPRGRLNAILNFVANLCDPNPYVYLAAAPVFVALARRRPGLALGVAGILFGANAMSQLLKPLLAEPRPAFALGGGLPVEPASWPSGHATAAMALTLASVLAAPPRLRPWVAAVGAAFAVAVSYSFLTLGWHYPSDVLGGFLVAVTWTLLAVGGLFVADAASQPISLDERSASSSIVGALGPPFAALLIALLMIAAVVLAHPRAVISYARGHEAFTAGGLAIGALALALATAIMLAVRK
jgi:membrane-associated phospholipid phosphatase